MKQLLFIATSLLSLGLIAEEQGKDGKRQLPPGLQKKLDSMSDEERAAFKEKNAGPQSRNARENERYVR